MDPTNWVTTAIGVSGVFTLAFLFAVAVYLTVKLSRSTTLKSQTQTMLMTLEHARKTDEQQCQILDKLITEGRNGSAIACANYTSSYSARDPGPVPRLSDSSACALKKQ